MLIYTKKQIMEQYDKIEKAYLKKFGEHSLDRVILFDPREEFGSNVPEAIQTLKKAMQDNKPIEQIPQERWDKLVF